MGTTLLWLSLIVLIPLAALFLKTTELSLERFVRIITSPRVLHALELSFGLSLAGRGGQSGIRLRGRLGAGALRVSRPAAARCHRRHSVRLADRRRRDRADQSLCRERLARPPAGAARHPGRVHAARHFRRAGIRRPAVRRAYRAAGAGGPGSGAGRGGGDARRVALDHHSPRHLSGHPAGAADRLCARLCAGGRRIRLGHLHRRQSAERLGDRAAADRHPPGGIPLCRRHRHRRGHAGRSFLILLAINLLQRWSERRTGGNFNDRPAAAGASPLLAEAGGV